VLNLSRRAFVIAAALLVLDARRAAAALPAITVYKDPG
jgi:hypothetical protein